MTPEQPRWRHCSALYYYYVGNFLGRLHDKKTTTIDSRTALFSYCCSSCAFRLICYALWSCLISHSINNNVYPHNDSDIPQQNHVNNDHCYQNTSPHDNSTSLDQYEYGRTLQERWALEQMGVSIQSMDGVVHVEPLRTSHLSSGGMVFLHCQFGLLFCLWKRIYGRYSSSQSRHSKLVQ